MTAADDRAIARKITAARTGRSIKIPQISRRRARSADYCFGFFSAASMAAAFLVFIEFSRPLPSGHRGLLRPCQRELAIRRVLGDGRSGADGRAGADSNRRHQHAAGADEGAIFDDGGPLILAIVIAGDAAGPDVDILTHPGIAQVRQMICLAARADLGVFDLDEVADMHVAMQYRFGPNSREGTDPAVLRHARMVDDAVREDFRAGSNLRIADDAIGTDLHALAQPHAADQDRIDVDEHVAADFHVSAYVDSSGIRQRRAGDHQRFCPFAPVECLHLRQLNLVVDAHDFRGQRSRTVSPRRDRPACTAPVTMSVR